MILVTGATGVVGRLLVTELLNRGAKVRAVSRTQSVPQVETVTHPTFDGVEAVFLHARAVQDHAALVRAAARYQVKRLVVLSAMNVDEPFDQQPSRANGDRNKEAEDAAIGSGLEWTSLRPSAFAGNTALMWGAQLRAGDVVRYVYPTFQESWIDERDLAAVAAHALLEDGVTGRKVDLTGPQSLSHEQGVATIGAVLGRSLRYEPTTAIPGPFGAQLTQRYARHLDSPQFPPTHEVATILGRPALTYAEWVAAHAATFEKTAHAATFEKAAHAATVQKAAHAATFQKGVR